MSTITITTSDQRTRRIEYWSYDPSVLLDNQPVSKATAFDLLADAIEAGDAITASDA